MERDLTGSTVSFSSFGGSSISDFDPDYEAFASTRPAEYEGESDDVFSVEIGRGPSKSTRGVGLDDSRSSMMSFQNSVRASSPAIRIDYPPNAHSKSATRNSSKRAVSENLRRDAQLRQANLANKKTLEPQSKPSRKDQKRSLSEMHATIRDAYDSFVLDDDNSLPAMPISTRTTRFGNRPSREVQLAVQKAGDDGFVRHNNQRIEGKRVRNSRYNVLVNNTSAGGDTGTQHSIVLPDLYNLSELVSGVYEESAPSPARQHRARTTRFVSPPHDIGDISTTREHQPLNFVPIPEDEKALFVSLRLLQDRAANLELAKSDAEKIAEQLRRENAALKAARSHRKDRRDRVAETYRSRPAEHSARSFAVDEDETRLTTIDENEIAKLRKKLEAERLARKHLHTTTKGDNTVESAISTHRTLPKSSSLRKTATKENKEPTIQQAVADEIANSALRSLPKLDSLRKPSIKENRHPTVRPASAGNDMTTSSRGNMAEMLNRPISERRRRYSDNCVNSASHHRRRQSAEDMTSAFILPDITLHHSDAVAERPGALDNVAQHKGQNCTVCKRVIPRNDACDHGLNIPRPIPVSDRISESLAYEEDHTLRPAQEPGVALATVLKALEDELAHLTMQLAAHQGAYYKLDPSMSRRKRKLLRQKIEKLLHEADMKADQIYSLYDVLEGQKKARHHMTEEQMEDTLQSIGIDIEQSQKQPESTRSKQSARKQAEADSDEEELPWEGIESTADITGRTGGSRRGY